MAQCVVVVALVEGHVALACGVVEARARGGAALEAPKDGAAEGLIRGAEGIGVAHALAAGRGGAVARRGEGTFDSPSQSVPHTESPGLMRSGTWPALYCLYLSASSSK